MQSGCGVLWGFANQTFCRQEQACDRRGVLQRGPRNFFWVDDSRFDEIGVLAGGDIIAFIAFAPLHLLYDHGALHARVVGQGSGRVLQGAHDNLDADSFIFVLRRHSLDSRQAADECDATTDDDAFLDSCPSGMEGVFHAGFRFLHFHVGSGTDADHGNPSSELG